MFAGAPAYPTAADEAEGEEGEGEVEEDEGLDAGPEEFAGEFGVGAGDDPGGAGGGVGDELAELVGVVLVKAVPVGLPVEGVEFDEGGVDLVGEALGKVDFPEQEWPMIWMRRGVIEGGGLGGGWRGI